MIQHISPRKTSSAIAPMRQPGQDLEQWGKWNGRHYYTLEMVQHPLRARMCGFGDKDRRPLAPAAVAKMVVKREDHSIVDVDDVDVSFFLVTVDLWSEDGKLERNLVLHPSSGERYVPVQTVKPRRRGASSNPAGPPPPSGHQTPIPRSTPTPSQFRPNEASPATFSSSQGYYPSPTSPMPPPSSAFSPAPSPYNQQPTWGYPSHGPDRNATYPPPILPSIHSFGRAGSSEPWASSESEPTYRGWSSSDTAFDSFAPSPVDASLKSGTESREGNSSSWEQPNGGGGGGSFSPASSVAASSPSFESSLYSASFSSHSPATSVVYYPTSASPSTFQHPPPPSSSSSGGPPPPSVPPPPLAAPPINRPQSAYTRTLVGPLSSNGYRLLDEHRKPGIFFLFQDLSVRTEGTFRLRLRLMNVGAPPAPEPGATEVHTSVSPVLAQIYSEPFTVYSAKRFPGVPETTALSIAFGNQGLKLPLRNRHGSNKRRRNGSDSDNDSD
ncbi:Velvet domain-containing protein [Mycena kentingensis (nom. inval.)]|nr:Velvet domain-containing protein [Mycena kentingensis (nom. inval.)]